MPLPEPELVPVSPFFPARAALAAINATVVTNDTTAPQEFLCKYPVIAVLHLEFPQKPHLIVRPLHNKLTRRSYTRALALIIHPIVFAAVVSSFSCRNFYEILMLAM
jgi:hypothetical protein